MRTFTFNIKDFRNIERVCGGSTGTYKGHPATEYIHYVCQNGICRAYGGNGIAVSKVTVPYTTQDNPASDAEEFLFLLPPVKGPYGTDKVVVYVDYAKNIHRICMINEKDDSKSSTMDIPKFKDDHEEYEHYFKDYNEAVYNRESVGNGLCIKINPRMLYDILKGYMHCDSVLLHIGNQVQPIKLESFVQEQDAQTYIMPIRYR